MGGISTEMLRNTILLTLVGKIATALAFVCLVPASWITTLITTMVECVAIV